ncbi:hypothetical protein PMAYCL1PPCAC_00422, partial [Pristionchus mayeri]
IMLLFLFYQCVFNGNATVESSKPPSDFGTVMTDLLQGSRMLLIDVGILRENEYRTSLLYRRLIPARGHGSAFAAYQETFDSRKRGESVLADIRPISLVHTVYPFIALSIGLAGGIVVFGAEMLTYYFR